MRIIRLLRDLFSILRAKWHFRSANLSKSVRVYGKLFVRNEGTLSIGEGSCFHRGPGSSEISVNEGGRFILGEGARINYGCIFNVSQSLVIGARCRVGYRVTILDNHLHQLPPGLRHRRPGSEPVEIGDDVWIGTGAIILPGVRIGNGSIIAAGAIVTRDVSPMTIVGSPAASFIRSVPDRASPVLVPGSI